MPFNHDTERLDWLERQEVEVREPARFGGLLIFQTQGTQHDAKLDYDSDLRAKIDIQLQILRDKGGLRVIAKDAPTPLAITKDNRPRICRAPPYAYDGEGWVCYGGPKVGIPTAYGRTPLRAFLMWRVFLEPGFFCLPFIPCGSELTTWSDGLRRIYQQTGLMCRLAP